MLLHAIIRNSLILGFFACLTAGVIAVVYVTTQDKIKAQIQQAQARALLEILPESTHDNDLLHDTILLPEAQLLNHQEKEIFAHLAKKNNEPIAIILPVIAPEGYAGRIHLLVGIYWDGTIAGVRVTQHQETPGLGDKIELSKSNWILTFNDKSITHIPLEQWQVKKDGGTFDQFTGATITPRAVVKAVYNALNYFKTHKEILFSRSSKS